MKKEIICTVCPLGCRILAEGTREGITSIEGFTCARGKEYGSQEFLHPVRILTSTVKADGEDRLIPVRSDRPVPRELLMDCMAVIRSTVVKIPVNTYDVIIPNICGCGANIVATADACPTASAPGHGRIFSRILSL